MEILGKRDYIMIKSGDRVLRGDLHLRSVDLLNLNNFTHRRALQASTSGELSDLDKQDMYNRLIGLMDYFTVDASKVNKVYSDSKNARFYMLEAEGKLIQIDKELQGLKDNSDSLFAWSNYRKPTHQTSRGFVIEEYLKIIKELKNFIARVDTIGNFQIQRL